MIDPLLAAQLCAQVYDTDQGWDHYWSTDDVVCAHRAFSDCDALVFRGSVTFEDWVRDADALPVSDPEVGLVHHGFLAGLDDLLAQALPAMQSPIVLTGHSLGGARARIAAGKLIARHRLVAQVITFGSPKPGYFNLANILQRSSCAHSSYRHASDVVPDLPPGSAWQHTEQYVELTADASDSVLAGAANHSMALYCKALAALA